MKKKEEEIYCVFCGTKNVKSDKKCKKCDKKLDPKNKLFKDYLKDHLKDDFKSNIEDTIFDLIKEWIIKHLFGITMTALIALVAGVVIVKENNIDKVQKQKAYINNVEEAFVPKKFCEEKDLTDKIRVCDDGYTLEGDSCVKRTSVPAKNNITCPSGYSMVDNKCVSDNTVSKLESFTCNDIPSIMIGADGWRRKTFGTVKQGNECYAKLCHELAGVAAITSESDCESIELVKSDKTSTFYCDSSNYLDASGNCHTIANTINYYTCSSGTLSGSSCISVDTKNYNEVCPSGTTYDEECSKCERGA
jgi:hypothetical protein